MVVSCIAIKLAGEHPQSRIYGYLIIVVLAIALGVSRKDAAGGVGTARTDARGGDRG
jgi:hypothetical protein